TGTASRTSPRSWTTVVSSCRRPVSAWRIARSPWLPWRCAPAWSNWATPWT
ncbi:unnamed protein product, partial [Durusdinium trenchii]